MYYMTSHHYSIFNGHSYWCGLKKLDTRKDCLGSCKLKGDVQARTPTLFVYKWSTYLRKFEHALSARKTRQEQ